MSKEGRGRTGPLQGTGTPVVAVSGPTTGGSSDPRALGFVTRVPSAIQGRGEWACHKDSVTEVQGKTSRP